MQIPLRRLLLRLLVVMFSWSLVLAVLIAVTGGLRSPYVFFSIGLLSGFLGVNLAAIRLTLIRGPILERVIDWSKVESMAAENS